jgi:hypothetical protein
MKLIKIDVFKSGAHLVAINNVIKEIPSGWALLPDDMETPNLPYGDITVEEIDGVPTVTSWTAGEIPEMPETPEVKAEPTADELIDILLGVSANE